MLLSDERAQSAPKTCRMMAIGPLAPIQNVLLVLEHFVLVEHTATVADAFRILTSRSPANIPEILIMPWWLPIVKSSDFIMTLKSHPILKSICVLVWGANMPVAEIRALYDAGASCVIPMPLQNTLIPVLRDLCIRIQHSK